MFNSTKYSNLMIRMGLTVVFLWFGIDKMFNPQHWLGAWTPPGLITSITKFGLNGVQLIYTFGIFEILIALSLASNVFSKLFSTLAIIFLIAILVMSGFNETTIKDIGLIGALLAIILWPNPRIRF